MRYEADRPFCKNCETILDYGEEECCSAPIVVPWAEEVAARARAVDDDVVEHIEQRERTRIVAFLRSLPAKAQAQLRDIVHAGLIDAVERLPRDPHA